VTSASAAESDSGQGATVHAFLVPPVASGPLDLTVTVEPLKSAPLYDLSSSPAWSSLPPDQWPMQEPGLVGPWVFHLSLPVQGATVVNPRQTVEAAGVALTLQSVHITATSVRVRLDPDLSAVRSAQFTHWTLDAVLQQGSGPAHALAWIPAGPDWNGQPIGPELLAILEHGEDGSIMIRQTDYGSDSPSGRWTLIVRRLTSASSCVAGSPWIPCDSPGPTTDMNGPWIFTFDVP
jgi:hypothetical protein